jgi:uncharacterized protein
VPANCSDGTDHARPRVETLGAPSDGPASGITDDQRRQLDGRGLPRRLVGVAAEGRYTVLHRMGDLGRELERRRRPDPYPRATGPAPSLEHLRHRRDEIERVAAHHGVRMVRVFGSVARGDAGPGSDVDLLVEMGRRRGLLEQAALQGDLEELLGCPVHVVTTGGLRQVRKDCPSPYRARSSLALSRRRDVDRLADMRAALADIRDLTDRDKEAFEADRAAQQAVAYNLAVLGEAARALSHDLRDRYSDVPWRDVVAQRNAVVHEYHSLDIESLWAAAEEDIPQLDQQLGAIEKAERDLR